MYSVQCTCYTVHVIQCTVCTLYMLYTLNVQYIYTYVMQMSTILLDHTDI